MHKALSNILQHYLRQETLVTGENGGVDEELLESLHKCLEEKGVLKEVHAFLRKRLVAVLEGSWPQLFDHFRTDRQLNPIVLKLIEDFLCSHRLLFTLSILTTELGDAFCPKVGFGKFSSLDAEGLLFNLGIRPDSLQSQKILENYSSGGNWSLFECIISFSPSGISEPLQGVQANEQPNGARLYREEISPKEKNVLTLDEKLKKIDDKYPPRPRQHHHQDKKHTNLKRAESLSVDQRFRHLALDLERDKQIQLQIAIDRFKAEEISRIKEEIETGHKFEFLRKEKELLVNYEEKVVHFKNNLEREKELWLLDKTQKEREIQDRKEDLLVAIQNLHMKAEQKTSAEASTQTEEHILSDHQEKRFNSEAERIVETYLFARTPEQREMERAYLLREAKLKLVIEKLQKDIHDLRVPKISPEPRCTPKISKLQEPEVCGSDDSNRPRSSPDKLSPSATMSKGGRKSLEMGVVKKRRPGQNYYSQNAGDDKWTGHFSIPFPDNDTVAFLQYQLECQSEEIEKLRSTMVICGPMEKSPPRKVSFQSPPSVFQTSKSPPVIPKYLESTEIDGFLREAKQRISDIEEEALLVEKTLLKINGVDTAWTPRTKFRIPYSRASQNLASNCLPLPPTLPKSLIQRLDFIRQNNNPVPKYFKPTLDLNPSIPSIPPMEKYEVLPSYRQQQCLAPLQTPLLPHHTGKNSTNSLRMKTPESNENDIGYEKLTALSKIDNDFSPLLKPTSTSSTKAPMQFQSQRIDEDAFTTRSNSDSSVSSLSRNIQDQQLTGMGPKNDDDKSFDHVPTLAEKKAMLEGESGDLSERQSEMESSLEKASRSGALVKNKVVGSGDANVERYNDRSGIAEDHVAGSGESGGDSISSARTTLKSSSTSFQTKSHEKLGSKSKGKESWNMEAEGERRFSTDLKSNPINANLDSTVSATLNKDDKAHKPQKPSLPFPQPENFEELDDLGMLETSEDLVLDENLFWRM